MTTGAETAGRVAGVAQRHPAVQRPKRPGKSGLILMKCVNLSRVIT